MNDITIYYNLVITHQRTVNDIPSTVRSQVIELLKQNGYEELITSDFKGV